MEFFELSSAVPSSGIDANVRRSSVQFLLLLPILILFGRVVRWCLSLVSLANQNKEKEEGNESATLVFCLHLCSVCDGGKNNAGKQGYFVLKFVFKFLFLGRVTRGWKWFIPGFQIPNRSLSLRESTYFYVLFYVARHLLCTEVHINAPRFGNDPLRGGFSTIYFLFS